MTGLRNPLWPRSWEGVVVLVAFVMGLGLAKVFPIAGLLVIVACIALMVLTWSGDVD